MRHKALSVVIQDGRWRKIPSHISRICPCHIGNVDVDIPLLNALQTVTDKHWRELNSIAIVEKGQGDDPAEFREKPFVSSFPDTRITDRPVANGAFDVSTVTNFLKNTLGSRSNGGKN